MDSRFSGARGVINRILVIDDDLSTLENFQGAFQRAGLGVATALTGMKGHDLARSGFDLILADLRLPDIGDDGGLRMLQRLRADGISTPLVIMTAYGSARTAREAESLGALDYIDKPFEDPLYALRRVLPDASITHWDELTDAFPSKIDYRVQRAIRIIDRELGTRLSVEHLAEQSCATPSRLRQLFKQETGLPIGRYIREKRLNAAATFLTYTNMRVSSIAYAVCFGNPAAFDRAFHQRYKMSPKEYRARRRGPG